LDFDKKMKKLLRHIFDEDFVKSFLELTIGLIGGTLLILTLTSCEKEIIPPQRILNGMYEVDHKEWILSDGTRKIYFPIGADVTGISIDGRMAQTRLTFQGDSLNIAQLGNNGWNDGWVDVEWIGIKPNQVGCHYVESVDEGQISWYQDDVIIKYIFK